MWAGIRIVTEPVSKRREQSHGRLNGCSRMPDGREEKNTEAGSSKSRCEPKAGRYEPLGGLIQEESWSAWRLEVHEIANVRMMNDEK